MSKHKPASKETAPPQPLSQPSRVHQPTKPAAEKEHPVAAMQRSGQKRPTSASRYRQEPEGINRLWFVLLAVAIVITILSSAWHKYTRRQHEMQQYRQQVAEEVAPVV